MMMWVTLVFLIPALFTSTLPCRLNYSSLPYRGENCFHQLPLHIFLLLVPFYFSLRTTLRWSCNKAATMEKTNIQDQIYKALILGLVSFSVSHVNRFDLELLSKVIERLKIGLRLSFSIWMLASLARYIGGQSGFSDRTSLFSSWNC